MMTEKERRGRKRRWFINEATWLVAVPVFIVGAFGVLLNAHGASSWEESWVPLLLSAILMVLSLMVMRYSMLTVRGGTAFVRSLVGRRLIDASTVQDVRVAEYKRGPTSRNMIELVLSTEEVVRVKGLTDQNGLPALGYANEAIAIARALGITSSERLARLDRGTGRLVYLQDPDGSGGTAARGGDI